MDNSSGDINMEKCDDEIKKSSQKYTASINVKDVIDTSSHGSHIKKHKKTLYSATKQDIFSCDQCDYTSNYKGNITKHKSTQHNGKKTERTPSKVEYSASMEKKLRIRKVRSCKECAACKAKECGVCKHCLDKPKFGGSNRMRQVCVLRVCLNKSVKEEKAKVKLRQKINRKSPFSDEPRSTSLKPRIGKRIRELEEIILKKSSKKEYSLENGNGEGQKLTDGGKLMERRERLLPKIIKTGPNRISIQKVEPEEGNMVKETVITKGIKEQITTSNKSLMEVRAAGQPAVMDDSKDVTEAGTNQFKEESINCKKQREENVFKSIPNDEKVGRVVDLSIQRKNDLKDIKTDGNTAVDIFVSRCDVSKDRYEMTTNSTEHENTYKKPSLKTYDNRITDFTRIEEKNEFTNLLKANDDAETDDKRLNRILNEINKAKSAARKGPVESTVHDNSFKEHGIAQRTVEQIGVLHESVPESKIEGKPKVIDSSKCLTGVAAKTNEESADCIDQGIDSLINNLIEPNVFNYSFNDSGAHEKVCEVSDLAVKKADDLKLTNVSNRNSDEYVANDKIIERDEECDVGYNIKDDAPTFEHNGDTVDSRLENNVITKEHYSDKETSLQIYNGKKRKSVDLSEENRDVKTESYSSLTALYRSIPRLEKTSDIQFAMDTIQKCIEPMKMALDAKDKELKENEEIICEAEKKHRELDTNNCKLLDDLEYQKSIIKEKDREMKIMKKKCKERKAQLRYLANKINNCEKNIARKCKNDHKESEAKKNEEINYLTNIISENEAKMKAANITYNKTLNLLQERYKKLLKSTENKETGAQRCSSNSINHSSSFQHNNSTKLSQLGVELDHVGTFRQDKFDNYVPSTSKLVTFRPHQDTFSGMGFEMSPNLDSVSAPTSSRDPLTSKSSINEHDIDVIPTNFINISSLPDNVNIGMNGSNYFEESALRQNLPGSLDEGLWRRDLLDERIPEVHEVKEPDPAAMEIKDLLEESLRYLQGRRKVLDLHI